MPVHAYDFEYEPTVYSHHAAAIQFQFNQSTYTVSESVGSLSVCIQLVAGYLSQQVNVAIQSQDGTAKGKADYSSTLKYLAVLIAILVGKHVYIATTDTVIHVVHLSPLSDNKYMQYMAVFDIDAAVS